MKPNIIIVEGIDRVGKSTLVNRIIEEFDYKLFVQVNDLSRELRNRKMEIETERLYSMISVMKLLEKDFVIIDRFHLSEFSYGIASRHYYNDEVSYIDYELSKLNSLLIYVKPTDLNKSSKEHGMSLDRHNYLLDICYENSDMNKIKCNYLQFDYIIKKLKDSFKEGGA